MFINAEVDLPEGLISAQRDGRLVIFAGAGVSMGRPANLPSFPKLAQAVAGSFDPPGSDEPLDGYLGRVAAAGIDVQGRTRKVIDDPASLPTALHAGLVGLFTGADSFRLVTTNFDRHFTTVVRDRFADDVDLYYGPALPLGREVAGLIYLHGAVEHPRNRLVLTDRDFGRAYLTDGWATRMLAPMFENFTVLFVGYSHDDTVMQYLARGLVPETRRYAFTAEGTESRWRRLGIVPIHYPLRPDPDRHEALTDSVTAWVEDANRGVLEHEARLRDIVRNPPPMERDLVDYLEAAFQDPVRMRFFAKYADAVEWLNWAVQRSWFEPLLDSAEPEGEVSVILAEWFADRFAFLHPVPALSLVCRQPGLQMAPVLWRAIARRLSFESTAAPDVLARWVGILVQTAPKGDSRWALTSLIEELDPVTSLDVAVVLFEHLTEPRLVVDSILGDVSRDEDGVIRIRGDVAVRGENYLLTEAWGSVFSPHLESLHAEILQICTAHLSEANRILRSVGAAEGEWDPLSFRRSAIEPHPQDHLGQPIDLLITGARDALEWALEHRAEVGLAFIGQWESAQAQLLRRLAIHGRARSASANPDQSLDAVIDRDWLYRHPLKHEVFQLLKAAYPSASLDAKRRLLEHSLRKDPLENAENDDDAQGIRDYARYNLATWLHQAAPDCDLTREHLAALQEAHPDFQPRDAPDLDLVIGEVTRVVPESPVSSSALISQALPDTLELLVEFSGDAWSGPSREGLLGTVRHAVKEDPAWALSLGEYLAGRSTWVADIWRALVAGWRDADLDDELWGRLLALLSNEGVDVAGDELADLLADGVQESSFPSDLLESAGQILDRLFVRAEALEADRGLMPDGNWLGVAINHVSGRVAQAHLQILARQQGEDEQWSGLPSEEKARVERVIMSSTEAAQLAKTVYGSQLAFFYHLDREWARSRLVPVFDWDDDPLAAEQVWHGFLTWGRLTQPILQDLLPYLVKSFTQIEARLGSHRESLCQRLAGVAVYADINPVEQGWLLEFIRDADEASRVAWARSMWQTLKSAEEPIRQSAWDRWIRVYWQARVEGDPRPLSGEEMESMVGWALALPFAFDDAVSLVVAHETGISDERFILHDIAGEDLPETHPAATASLLEHLLSSTERLPYDCPKAEAITRRLVAAGAPRECLQVICEHLARLGCAGAGDIRDSM